MTDDIYKNVTVEQFKEYFFRDNFDYLPVFIEGNTYWVDDIVYYNNQFYKSLIDSNTALPTDTEAWEITKDSILNYTTDEDIERAMSQAYIMRNPRFGNDDDERITIYLHLIAFYLCIDLKNADAGYNSTYSGMEASKSVDGVSVSYNFPQWLLNNPLYSIYMQNGYGMKYLSLILPYLSVTVLFSTGRTTCG